MTTPTATTILPSRNEGWGFFGTIRNDTPDAAEAWAIASRLLAEETTCSPEGVRDFLDSRMGRHFADVVACDICDGLALEPAIASAIKLHQSWTISKATERKEGIPAGLPFLTGWIAHFEILADMAAEEEAGTAACA